MRQGISTSFERYMQSFGRLRISDCQTLLTWFHADQSCRRSMHLSTGTRGIRSQSKTRLGEWESDDEGRRALHSRTCKDTRRNPVTVEAARDVSAGQLAELLQPRAWSGSLGPRR